MSRLLTRQELKSLPKGTKLKSINGQILTKGIDRLSGDTRCGVTSYSIYKPKNKKQ